MGALTSKNLPFELREWDIEYFESIDPTDSFGSNTRVYIKENQIVQIEPDYNVYTHDLWITDKGRQFFDSIFNKRDLKQKNEIPTWTFVFKTIIQTIYFVDFFNCFNKNNKKFTIIFENLGLEILSFLTILQNSFSFLNIKKAEKNNIYNDLESNFQLNLCGNKNKLNLSTFCLIVSNNPRYEGYYLNLYLKKRFSKGNFECSILGSLINLTFFTSFIGFSTNIFKNILKGKHLICQKLKSKKKPCLILNSDFFKRSDSIIYLKTLQILQQSNIISTNWNGINILNYSLYENGTYATTKYQTLKLKDFLNFSVLYFLNVGANNSIMLKKLTKSKLLNFYQNTLNIKKDSYKFLILDHSQLNYNKSILFNKNNQLNKNNYYFIPNSTFYENEDTFINTKGFFCKTIKLISKKTSWYLIKETTNNWEILRNLFNLINKKIVFCSHTKNNNSIFPIFNLLNYYKNFINFNFYATIGLTNLNYYLNKQNKPFLNLNYKYKQKVIKMYNTKLNYWLNDFYIGGKDEFSCNSKVLNCCSNILKEESTLFF